MTSNCVFNLHLPEYCPPVKRRYFLVFSIYLSPFCDWLAHIFCQVSPGLFVFFMLFLLFILWEFFFFFTFYFILEYGRLTNNVVIVSGEQQRDSAIHIHVPVLPQTPLPSRLPHCRSSVYSLDYYIFC